jgi:hypothetical protein
MKGWLDDDLPKIWIFLHNFIFKTKLIKRLIFKKITMILMASFAQPEHYFWFRPISKKQKYGFNVVGMYNSLLLLSCINFECLSSYEVELGRPIIPIGIALPLDYQPLNCEIFLNIFYFIHLYSYYNLFYLPHCNLGNA